MSLFNFEEAEKKTQTAITPSFNFEEAEKKTKAAVFDFEAAERVGNRPTPEAVSPTRPTPQQIERQQGAALTPTGTVPQERKRSLLAPPVDPLGLSKPETPYKGKDDAKKPIAFKELYTNPEYLKTIEDYATVRFGKTGKKLEGETSEDYVNRFARHMRFITSNEINYFTEQDWLNTSKSEDVVKAGDAYRLFEDTAGFLSEGGQSPIRALADYTSGVISAPSTAASLGVGKIVTGPLLKKATTEGLKKAVLSRTGATALGAPMTVEVATNVSANLYDQRRELSVVDATAKEMEKLLPSLPAENRAVAEKQIEELKAKVDEGLDVKQALVVGAITAPISLVIETAPLLALSKSSTKYLPSDNFTLKDILDARKQQLKIASAPTELTGDKAADNIAVTTTNIYDGGDLLDDQGAPTAIAQMQIKNSIDKQADMIAASIWQQMPEMAPKLNEKTFEAVQRTLDNFDKLDRNVINKALEEAGTDLPDFIMKLEAAGLEGDALQKFSAMYGVSVSDAARTMQSKSVISRMLNKARDIDPEAAKAVDALMGKPDVTTNAMSTLMSFVRKLDRNMITGLTVNFGTMMRNAFGAASGLTFGAAEDAIESAIFSTGLKLAGHAKGEPIKGSIKKGLNAAFDDTIDTFYYLNRSDLSKDITEEALKNNPMLMSKMLATGEALQKSDLIAPIRILNTPAVLMDNYIRRAVFASSIDANMRKVGLNLFDVMAEGKNIPIDVLRRGVDDALDFTFSKTPTEGVGLAFVKGVEYLRPASTLVFPFARFLVNATKWTVKHYNPGITTVTGASDVLKGIGMVKAGDESGRALMLQGSKKIAQQATGMATFIAAYKYRAENQDTDWNTMKSDDGTTVDMQYLFPLNVPFALADFAYKSLNGRPEDFKTMQLVEALTGFKAVGSTAQVLEEGREAVSAMVASFSGVESDEAALAAMQSSWGDFAGAWLGRATVPLNQISDIISAFDSDESLRRDVFVAEPGETLSGGDIFTRQIQKGIPILKQMLPEYQPATRETSPKRETALFKQATGLSLIQPKNEIEKEIEALNIPFQSVFRTTGDKTLDAQARKIMAERIEDSILPIVQSDSYKMMTREGKFRRLQTELAKLQNVAKEEATNLSIADFYERGLVPPIERKKFNALNPKIRQLTLALYKEQFGESLNESKDPARFRVALELSKVVGKNPEAVTQKSETPEFAVGGFIGKNVAKKLGKGVALDETAAMLQAARKAAAPTEPVTPVVAPSEAVVEPVAAVPVKPTTTSVYEFPNKAFTDEEYAAAEAQMLEEGGQMYKNMKVTQPQEYANTLQSFTAVSKGIKYKDMPPSPYKIDNTAALAADDAVEAADDVVESTYKNLPPNDAPTPVVISDKAMRGSIKDVKQWQDRDDMLNQIKEVRIDSFADLRSNPSLRGIEDAVIGTVQGDFRFTKGREVNPSNTKDAAEFAKMARVAQTKLNRLREKYKDVPPKKLYHGSNDPVKAEQLRKRGFVSSRELKPNEPGQVELKVNIASFGSDPNMQFKSGAFGGRDPERFVAVEIPYADYLFSRVNMPQKAYSEKNLNVIARAISGAPKHVRPLGLPRATMNETEDSIVDFEKLTRRSGMLTLPDDELIPKIEKFNISLDKRETLKKKLLGEVIEEKQQDGSVVKVKQDGNIAKYSKNKDMKSANELYRDIRGYAKMLFDNAKITATKTGIGQRFDTDLVQMPVDADLLRDLAKTLREGGSTERADLLNKFANNLNPILKPYNYSVKEQNKARQSLMTNIPKLNKGGLVSRKD